MVTRIRQLLKLISLCPVGIHKSSEHRQSVRTDSGIPEANKFSEMSVPPSLGKLFNYIDLNSNKYIKTLREAVAIQSVSSETARWNDCVLMAEWTSERLKELGATVTLRDVGYHEVEGTKWKLPPVIVATLGNDKNKPCVCIYGHLDVQPAHISDGWNTEPFDLTEIDGKLFGRGSTDDKGPVLGWIHAIEAFKAVNVELPVNLKFILECMEESGSTGLDDLLLDKLKPEGFFADVDYICISDNYWLGPDKPSITYGLRGICYFFLEVHCAEMDLHSGIYGGTVHEAMTDLVYLLSTLVSSKGKILVKDIYKDVAAETKDEAALYKDITFSVNEYRDAIGAHKLLHNEEKSSILKNRWRYPTLSIHGIEGAFSGIGSKTVIPGKVVGKFSLRIVPNMKPEDVVECVTKHLQEKMAETGSPNKLKVTSGHAGKWWMEDPLNAHYQAAAEATKIVYKVDPDMTREGGSIPVTLTLQEASGCSVLLLPMGASDDMAHSQNEKLNVRNYIEGTKLLAAYFHEVGKLPKRKQQ